MSQADSTPPTDPIFKLIATVTANFGRHPTPPDNTRLADQAFDIFDELAATDAPTKLKSAVQKNCG